MKLIFTKGPGKFDHLAIHRPGTAVETIDCPKQRIIPHDMVHLAVESTLHARGFLGRLKAGEAASFRMQAEDVSDGIERLVEVFQGDEWSGGTSAPGEMLDLYRVTCDARSCSTLPVGEAEVLAIRARISALTQQWQALAVGESLALEL